MRSRAILAGLLIFLFLAGLAWAQASPDHDLSWHVLAGGGREGMASGAHVVHGTLGQLAIGPAGGTGHGVGAGYWYGLGPRVQPAPYHIYLAVLFRG